MAVASACPFGVSESVKTRTLRLAARIAGGPARLRARLRVPAETLGDWLAGDLEPPDAALLKALEIILDDLDARD